MVRAAAVAGLDRVQAFARAHCARLAGDTPQKPELAKGQECDVPFPGLRAYALARDGGRRLGRTSGGGLERSAGRADGLPRAAGRRRFCEAGDGALPRDGPLREAGIVRGRGAEQLRRRRASAATTLRGRSRCCGRAVRRSARRPSA